VTRAEIQTAARRWLNVRWQHQGRTRFGIDCGGVWVKVAEELHYAVEDLHGYSRLPDGATIDRHISRFMETKPVSQAAPGDLVLMGAALDAPCHVGFITAFRNQGLGLLHSSADLTVRKVAEHILDDHWRPAIRKCWQFRGVED